MKILSWLSFSLLILMLGKSVLYFIRRINGMDSFWYFDVYHIFNIRHTKRDALKDYLLKNEIKTDIHYPVAPNKQKAMIGIIDDQTTPIAEKIHQTTLSLPISFYHSEEDILRVIEAMNKF